jgi:RNA polymerase sigma-70 factor (ECF subfamily)
MRKKNNADIGRLASEHHGQFLRFVRSRVKNEHDAEDILQTAYRKGLEKTCDLRENEKVIAWFYRILRNAIIDHYRKRGVEKRRMGTSEEAENLPVELDSRMEKAVCKCVGDLIPTMKPEYAEAIKEIELEEKSLKGFAAKKGLTSNNAMVRLYRARQSLKKRLLETCGTCAEHGCLDCNCRRV